MEHSCCEGEGALVMTLTAPGLSDMLYAALQLNLKAESREVVRVPGDMLLKVTFF